MSLEWVQQPPKALDENVRTQAEARQRQLTKPPGSLARLEQLACQFAALQGVAAPTLDRVVIVVFAADHGVAVEGVSAFPQEVTVEMVRNFARGGAAISVLARELGAQLEVVNVGTVSDPGKLAGVVDQRIAAGSANICDTAAMSHAQLVEALAVGRAAVLRAQAQQMQLFIGGEMGIANTTAATAVACALLQQSADSLTGPGTGLDEQGVRHKVAVITRALARHNPDAQAPLEVLRCLGGLEITALAGAYIASAQAGIPVLVDGFIATCAALLAVCINPQITPWLLYAHHSSEPGHKALIDALQARPLLDLGLHLGEASGAALALPLLRLALALHNGMATFAEAGISGSQA